ncbi:MAG: hypothetical protein H0T76_28550 [Nannocystis sp.]|nr:hypothetical protein [Nannocystis sp.]MBA3550445.1 hypothetical protein [Nannocystis sp.]
MTTTMVAMAMLMAAGCNSGDGGDTEGASGTEAPTTGTATTAGETSTGGTSTGETSTGETPTSTGETPTTGGAAALTPADLVGSFKSPGCESYPNGMGGDNYLTRDFTLTETTWHLDLVLYGDAGCTAKLFTSVIDGPYTLLGASATVAGATEGDFGFGTIVWTAHMANMADTFTMAGCGAAPWEVEVPQDVTATGCIGVAHSIAQCPTDHDVVSLAGDDLYFGQRITDMCSEAGRPAALGPFPVVRA